LKAPFILSIASSADVLDKVSRVRCGCIAVLNVAMVQLKRGVDANAI
jgi:hypothetical protein